MTSARQATGLPQPQGIGEEPLQYVTRVYLAFLQGIFSVFEAGAYRWSEDEQLSEINISDQSPFPFDRLEQRPAIVATMGPAQWANLSLDNLENLDFKTGKRRHSDLVSATMSLNVLAKMGPEARRLAWIVFSSIRRHNRLLQKNTGIHQVGNLMSMGQESAPGALVQPEADSEVVLVTVSSPFFFKWTEEITPLDAAKASAIQANLQATIDMTPTSKLAEAEVLLRRPTFRGTPLPDGYPLDRQPLVQKMKT